MIPAGNKAQHFSQYSVKRKTIKCHLNINSIWNKFLAFIVILSKTDIFLLSKTKIDKSSPNSQFFAKGYWLVLRERNINGSGLLHHVKENISIKLVNTCCFSEENDVIALEYNISNKKWLQKVTEMMSHLFLTKRKLLKLI